jgi:hypothetical protein
MPDMPGSDPIPPKAGTFDFEGARYTFDPERFNAAQPLVLLPDGRLLRAAGFDNGVPFDLSVVRYEKAALE